MKHQVTVWGKTYEVSVYQKSKAVWVAIGYFDQVLVEPGKTAEEIRVQGRSEGAALSLWRETAKYRGN